MDGMFLHHICHNTQLIFEKGVRKINLIILGENIIVVFTHRGGFNKLNKREAKDIRSLHRLEATK